MGVKTTSEIIRVKISLMTSRFTDRTFARNSLILGLSNFYDDIRLIKSDQRHFIVDCAIVIDSDIEQF